MKDAFRKHLGRSFHRKSCLMLRINIEPLSGTCQFDDMSLPYPKGDFANLKMTL